MYTQVYENAVRVNNAITFIPEDTGIDIDAYGGLPGEVQIIRPGSAPPTMSWPQPMPQHMVQLPELLFQKIRQYQGFSPSRQGQTSAGNISADLFDASVFQSQSLTRLRGRMLAESVLRIAQLVFYFMARFKTQPDVYTIPANGKLERAVWRPVSDVKQNQLYLDEGSIRPLSGAALRQIVLALAKTGILPPKFILKSLDIPGADQIAEEAEQQMKLAAAAKLKRPR